MNVFDSIMTGLNEAVKHEKGIIKAKRVKCTVNPIPEFSASDIKNVRNKMNMTQVTFAAVMGVSAKAVEAWESGKNVPSGSARRMLGMLKTDPNLPEKYNIIE